MKKLEVNWTLVFSCTVLSLLPAYVFVKSSALSPTTEVVMNMLLLPVALCVGLGIGIGASRLQAPGALALIGSTFGWLAGTILAIILIDVLRYPDSTFVAVATYVLQVVMGTVAGLLPSLAWVRFNRQ